MSIRGSASVNSRSALTVRGANSLWGGGFRERYVYSDNFRGTLSVYTRQKEIVSISKRSIY